LSQKETGLTSLEMSGQIELLALFYA
jgi:hypothetical protein